MASENQQQSRPEQDDKPTEQNANIGTPDPGDSSKPVGTPEPKDPNKPTEQTSHENYDPEANEKEATESYITSDGTMSIGPGLRRAFAYDREYQNDPNLKACELWAFQDKEYERDAYF